MARISVLALFAVALAAFAQGNPFKFQSSLDITPVHTTSSWEYEDCGQYPLQSVPHILSANISIRISG